MTTEETSGSKTYMIVAAVLMVCLLAFGSLHTMGVFR